MNLLQFLKTNFWHLLQFITAITLTSFISGNTFGATDKAPNPKSTMAPNIVVILTDDQGWGDLSVRGNGNIATPNIDSLARDGATLEHFYVCQVCAPTRAEFLTGRSLSAGRAASGRAFRFRRLPEPSICCPRSPSWQVSA